VVDEVRTEADMLANLSNALSEYRLQCKARPRRLMTLVSVLACAASVCLAQSLWIPPVAAQAGAMVQVQIWGKDLPRGVHAAEMSMILPEGLDAETFQVWGCWYDAVVQKECGTPRKLFIFMDAHGQGWCDGLMLILNCRVAGDVWYGQDRVRWINPGEFWPATADDGDVTFAPVPPPAGVLTTRTEWNACTALPGLTYRPLMTVSRTIYLGNGTSTDVGASCAARLSAVRSVDVPAGRWVRVLIDLKLPSTARPGTYQDWAAGKFEGRPIYSERKTVRVLE
jgi:hypothetical protein